MIFSISRCLRLAMRLGNRAAMRSRAARKARRRCSSVCRRARMYWWLAMCAIISTSSIPPCTPVPYLKHCPSKMHGGTCTQRSHMWYFIFPKR